MPDSNFSTDSNRLFLAIESIVTDSTHVQFCLKCNANSSG